MQIKTTVRYQQFTPVGMVVIKEARDKFWQSCGEEVSPVHGWWGCTLVQSLCKTVLRGPKS